MKSVAAIGSGLFAEAIVVLAFYSFMQVDSNAPGELVADLFLMSLAVVGVLSTWIARRVAAPGLGRKLATAGSGVLFTLLFLFMAAIIADMQDV